MSEEKESSFISTSDSALLASIKGVLKVDEAPKVSEELLAEIKKHLLESNKKEVALAELATTIGQEEATTYAGVMTLLFQKQILGFINDKGTDAISDDIIILRKSRLIDSMSEDD